MNLPTFPGSTLAAAIAIAVCSLQASANEGPPKAPLDLRVMSFNIKQHNPDNPENETSPHHWNLRKAIVSRVIREAAPDVAGLQEAYRHQLDDLAEALPGFSSIGHGRDGGAHGEHCAILFRESRFRLGDSGTFWLSDTPELKSRTWGHFYFRICTWARLVEKSSGRAFYVLNTHFDHQSQDAREKSARLIARRIHERTHPDPVILIGDFNAGEGNPAITYLLGDHAESSPAPLVDSFRLLHPDAKEVGTGNGFTGIVTGEKVDHILVTPGTEVLEAAIVRTREGDRYPSDHFPVTAVLRLPGQEGSPPARSGPNQ